MHRILKGKLKGLIRILKENDESEKLPTNKKFNGMFFWVIGAGTGYGRVIASTLAASGAHIFVSGRRSEKLNETKACIEKTNGGGSCFPLVMDATDEKQVRDTALRIAEISNAKLDGMVYSAALPQGGKYERPLHEEPRHVWDMRFETNVTGALLCTREASRLMLKHDSMRVLFLSSAAGWAYTTGFGPYNVTKAALNSLGASLAAEYKTAYPDKLIQINIIDPGEAKTEMNQGSDIEPWIVWEIVEKILSCENEELNGKFFRRDGVTIPFCDSEPYYKNL